MSRSVNIKISQRILSVGDSSFPVHNISSTQIVEPEFKFPQVLAAGLSAVAGLIFFAMTRSTRSSAVMGGPPEFVREHAYTVDLPTTICTAVAVILLPIGICQVARRLYVRSTVRILVVASAGLSGVAIASRNLAQLRKISLEIASAINNPLADFQITIEKFHLGDNINVNGPNGTAIRVMK